MPDLATNLLQYGDNLDILRRYLADAGCPATSIAQEHWVRSPLRPAAPPGRREVGRIRELLVSVEAHTLRLVVQR